MVPSHGIQNTENSHYNRSKYPSHLLYFRNLGLSRLAIVILDNALSFVLCLFSSLCLINLGNVE